MFFVVLSWLYQTKQEENKMQCTSYHQALEIANSLYDADHLVNAKNKIYFQKRGYNSWFVILPVNY